MQRVARPQPSQEGGPVLWVPMACVPKGNSQRIVRRGGFPRLLPSKRAVEAQHLLASALRRLSAETHTGPVWRDVCFVLRIPTSWPAWRRRAALELRWIPTYRPDTGNLVKLLDDAIEEAGIVHNDSQIVGGSAVKLYGPVPGYRIRITPLPQATRLEPSRPFTLSALVPPRTPRTK